MPNQQNNNILLSTSSRGAGRPLILLLNKDSPFCSSAERLAQSCSDSAQTHLLILNEFGENWRTALDELLAYLDNNSIRNASFLGFEDCTVLLQALCFKKPRLIRTLIFVDPATRSQPSDLDKFLEKLESFLPLGLPFRSDFSGFDGKSSLQRIRSPLLIVSSLNPGVYRKEQARIINNNVPTSFLTELNQSYSADNTEIAESLKDIIEQFQEIPAKCPQKNLSSAKAGQIK